MLPRGGGIFSGSAVAVGKGLCVVMGGEGEAAVEDDDVESEEGRVRDWNWDVEVEAFPELVGLASSSTSGSPR